MQNTIGIPDTTPADRDRARRAWAQLECVHTLVYFAPAVREAHAALGLPMPQGGYVATRMVGAGAVTAPTAIAALYGFAPAFVHAALPASWEVAPPELVYEATMGAIDATLTPLVDGLLDPVRRAAELAREAAELHPLEGRAMAASRAALPWPEPSHLVLWEAATRIREARGDVHHALALAAGLDGGEIHLTVTGDTPQVRELLGPRRGWTDPEWSAAAARLRSRGLLDDAGALTAAGRTLRDELETATDAVSAPPWQQLGSAKADQLDEAMQPIVAAIVAADVLPARVTARVTG